VLLPAPALPRRISLIMLNKLKVLSDCTGVERSDTIGIAQKIFTGPAEVARVWHPFRMHDPATGYRRSALCYDLRLQSAKPSA